MEEVEDLLGFDAQPSPEGPSVVREVIVDLGLELAQAAPELTERLAGLDGEVLGDGEVGVGCDEEPLRLAAVVAGPEHLGQRDRRTVGAGTLGGAGEGRRGSEDGEQHRVVLWSAQADRTGAAGLLVVLRLVVTENVRAQVALAGVGARRLVVRDAVGGQQQRGDGVDERRLA